MAYNDDLLARLTEIDGEIEAMTVELIARQDQLVALYDLIQSTRGHLSTEDALCSLLQASTRLIPCRGAFAVLASPVGAPTLVQHPAPMLDDGLLLDLFRQVQDVGQEILCGEGNERMEAAEPCINGVRSLLVIPIRIHDTVRAVLGLVDRKEGNFSAPDLKLARAIAAHAAAHIENVLLHQDNLRQAKLETELQMAAGIQARLLPQVMPVVAGLDIAGRSRPAQQVGGDFYDLARRGGQLFVFAGDVSGKGMSAALLMSIAHTVINNAMRFMPAPTAKALMARINEDLYDDFTDVGMFATAFVGCFDPSSRAFTYANGGHSPVIYRPAGGSAHLLVADGTAVGVLPLSLCEEQCLLLEPDDLLVIATDGLCEAVDAGGHMFGYDRLLDLVDGLAAAPAALVVATLLDAVERFAVDCPQADDQTLVVLKGVA